MKNECLSQQLFIAHCSIAHWNGRAFRPISPLKEAGGPERTKILHSSFSIPH
jgi:hypothetical protein